MSTPLTPDDRLNRVEQRLDRIVTALDTQGGLLQHVVAALDAQAAHLISIDARTDRTNARLAGILDQLRHMNEGIIRALGDRAEMALLRARVDALEARFPPPAPDA